MRLRNYSERTISSYVSSLVGLSKFYNCSPMKLTSEQIKDYAYHLLQTKKVSPSTINQLISAWKILQVDILNKDWEKIKLKRARREKKLPMVLSQKETIALVGALSNKKHRAILSLAYATGMRRCELLQLKPSDIDTERKVIRVVRGKGNKTREIPIQDGLIRQLREYYKSYHPKTYLFEGQVPGTPYSESSMYKVVKNAGKKVNLKKKPSPHVLRHCFATHMLERGMNLKRLQLLMGHNSLSSTSIYLHLAAPTNEELPNLLSLPKNKSL